MLDDEMEEGARIREITSQMMAVTRQTLKIAKATGLSIDLTLIPDEYNDTFTGWFKIGDYELWVKESIDLFRLDYEPQGQTQLWQHDVDPERIVSFTMPPIGERP